MLVNIVLSLVLIFPLRHVGLAAAISVAALVNTVLLYRGLRRHRVYQPLSGWALFLVRVFAASALMGLVLVWGSGDFDSWIEAGVWERIGRLAFWVIVGIMVYGVAIFALGLRPTQLTVRREASMFRGDE